jgi:hypothetical protein
MLNQLQALFASEFRASMRREAGTARPCTGLLWRQQGSGVETRSQVGDALDCVKDRFLEMLALSRSPAAL